MHLCRGVCAGDRRSRRPPVVRVEAAAGAALTGLAESWQARLGGFSETADLHDPAGVSKECFGDDAVARLLSVASPVQPNRTRPLVSPFRVADLAGLLPLSATRSTTSAHHHDVGQAADALSIAVCWAG